MAGRPPRLVRRPLGSPLRPTRPVGCRGRGRPMDAVGQAELVRTGEVSPAELVDAAIARIEALNPQLNAVVRDRFERARAEAAGELPDGPFRGVPLLLKDLSAEIEGETLYEGMRFLRDADHHATRTDALAPPLPRRRLRRARPHQHARDRAAARPPSPTRTARRTTRGSPATPPAGRAAARRPRSRAAWSRSRTRTTAAARSASRRRAAGSSGSSRRAAACRPAPTSTRSRTSSSASTSCRARCATPPRSSTSPARRASVGASRARRRRRGPFAAEVGADPGSPAHRVPRRRSRPARAALHPECVTAVTDGRAPPRVARPPRRAVVPAAVGRRRGRWSGSAPSGRPSARTWSTTGPRRSAGPIDRGRRRAAHLGAHHDGPRACPDPTFMATVVTAMEEARRAPPAGGDPTRPTTTAEGYDLLLTPTLGEPPPPHGTFAVHAARQPLTGFIRAGRVRAVHDPEQHLGPARDQPAPALDRRRSARSASSSSPRSAARTC